MKGTYTCRSCPVAISGLEGNHCDECRAGNEVRKALDTRTRCARCGKDSTRDFVFDDANMVNAVDWAAQAIFRNADHIAYPVGGMLHFGPLGNTKLLGRLFRLVAVAQMDGRGSAYGHPQNPMRRGAACRSHAIRWVPRWVRWVPRSQFHNC